MTGDRKFIMTDGASSSGSEKSDHCPNSWFGSHNFEPRYDLSPADFSFFAKAREFKLSSVAVEKMRTQTYVRDVCTKCGKTIEREAK